MNIFMKSAVVTAVISVIAISAQAKEKTDRALVKPGEAHELCMTLEFGKRLTYGFTSHKEMNFNIHFNEGDEIVYPVEEHLTREKNEIFTATSDQEHCLMWTNPNDRGQWVNVVYQVR